MKRKYRQVKFSALKIGDLTVDSGLIVFIGRKGNKDSLNKGDPFIRFFNANDSYYGKMERRVFTKEPYSILHERGTKGYERYLRDIIKDRVDCEHQAKNDIELLHAWLKR